MMSTHDSLSTHRDGYSYFYSVCVRVRVYNMTGLQVTCATDTRNVRVVFGACKDIILKQNLQESGFME